ncbi:hypothetical protein [Enterococcus sp. AZ109]|uniref:hypothetical protein n=1 Tax=Enterococcus sp. AZ109 TaxID=2774634 RepID=UPI003F6874AB
MNNESGIKVLCSTIDLSFLDVKAEDSIHVSVDFGMLDEVIEGSYPFEGDAGDLHCSSDELKQGLLVSISEYQTIKPELSLSGAKTDNQWMNQTDTIRYYFRYSGKKDSDGVQDKLPKTRDIQLYLVQIAGFLCTIVFIFLYNCKRR